MPATAAAAAAHVPLIVGKYEMGRVLATGDFDCRTRICTHIVTGAQYVVRIYDKTILAEASWMWNQTREAVQVMRTLPKHENIVEMVECFETETSLYILMQMHSPMQITKLYTTAGRDSVIIPLSRTKHLFTQVVRGIMHMHDNSVVHCGIAPDHMLVNDRDQLKIGFLVSCRFYQRNKLMSEMRGTKHTVAPEVLRQEPYNPVLADSWSLGVLLFFMLNGGQYPHDGANTTKHILNNKMRTLNPALPVQARDLVAQLLAYDPAQRLTVGDIFNHPWMLEDRAEEDVEFLQRNANLRQSVESNYDPGNDIVSITLPYGLSREEEAAYIIQHMWLAYKRRKDASPDMLRMMKRAPRIGAIRLRRITSTIKRAAFEANNGGHRKKSVHDGGADGMPVAQPTAAALAAAERRMSRNSVVSLPAAPPHSAGSNDPIKRFNRFYGPTTPTNPSGSPHSHDFNHHHHGSPTHVCNHCGRKPPQRIAPGKSPYPNAKFALTAEGEFVPIKREECEP